ncbi:MAG: dihydrolipoamide acetyltransferase family protein [Sphingomonadales bacterium]
MSRFVFRLPDIGEGVTTAEIVAWHVKPGDRIEQDGRLADVMTDKATVEMESPVAGTVVELAGEVGDAIAIGSALAVIETAAGEESKAFRAETPPRPAANLAETGVAPATAATMAPAAKAAAEPVPEADAAPRQVLASPAVRKRAMDLGIDLSMVRIAEGDRVRHSDLDAYLRYSTGEGYQGKEASRAWADQAVPVTGLRRRIAENMAAAKRRIPHFSYVEEIDVTELERMRAALNDNRGNRAKLTLLPFMIVAICRSLPAFPMLNARYDDEAGTVARSGRVHMGMATQTDSGLMVPVIRDAQDRNVWQLAAEIGRLAEAARAGKATREELSGSTITVTSLGPLAGIASTPVINRPEVAIIAPNRIIERPVFDGDDIARAKLMNLSMSCDHRVVDGWDAASFVQEVKRYLETPVLLFAE